MSTEGFEGEGLEFYRCTMCGSVVSVWDIEKHRGCKVCKNPRIKPTELSMFEKIMQILMHPMIWKWKAIARSSEKNKEVGCTSQLKEM